MRRAAMKAAILIGTVLGSFAKAQTLSGLWASDGYGDLLEIQGDQLRMFEVTAVSCLASSTAARQPGAPGTKEAVFTSSGLLVRFSAGSTSDELRAHVDGAASDLILHRVRSRPPVCGKAAANTPQSNYAVFWQTFAEHYAFFKLRQTDWREVDARFRHQVTAGTTAEELFGIFRQMVEPLHDAHTGIVARDIKKNFSGRRPDPNHLEPADWKKAAETIESKYVRGGLRSFCNGRVQFGMLDGSIGYLRITGFQGYADSHQYADSLSALQSALDSIFREGGRLRGLVIDVRLNTGGADPLGLEIASRLTTENSWRTARYRATTQMSKAKCASPRRNRAG